MSLQSAASVFPIRITPRRAAGDNRVSNRPFVSGEVIAIYYEWASIPGTKKRRKRKEATTFSGRERNPTVKLDLCEDWFMLASGVKLSLDPNASSPPVDWFNSAPLNFVVIDGGFILSALEFGLYFDFVVDARVRLRFEGDRLNHFVGPEGKGAGTPSHDGSAASALLSLIDNTPMLSVNWSCISSSNEEELGSMGGGIDIRYGFREDDFNDPARGLSCTDGLMLDTDDALDKELLFGEEPYLLNLLTDASLRMVYNSELIFFKDFGIWSLPLYILSRNFLADSVNRMMFCSSFVGSSSFDGSISQFSITPRTSWRVDWTQ
jgi:hypothetical protein